MRVIFNETNHTYTLGDKLLISVTQLLKKHGLVTDYSGVDAETLEKAAEKGKLVHKEIEEYIKTGEIGFTSELLDYINIAEEIEFVPDKSEVVLPDIDIDENEIDNYIYAGTADIIGNSKYGRTLIDIKTTQKVDRRGCAWQLSLYERQAGEKFDKMLVFHLGEKSKPIPIDRIPEAEVGKLLECERNGEIYQEPGLVATGDLLAKAQAAEMELIRAEQAKKVAEAEAKGYRQKLYELMEKQGIASWETVDKAMKITLVAPTTQTKIDSKKLQEELPDIAKQYSKTSNVKGYVKITIREE